MILKLRESFQILKNNFILISFIIFTTATFDIFLDAFDIYKLLGDSHFFKDFFPTSFDSEIFKLLIYVLPPVIMKLLVHLIFNSLSIGSLLYVISNYRKGISVNYIQTIKFALEKWKSVLGSNLLVLIYTLAGLNIVLSTHYFFVEEAVVIENEKISLSRKRSSILTMGRRWSIFYLIIFYIILSLIFSFIKGSFTLPIFESNKVLFAIIIDYFKEFVFSVLYIYKFLFYLEAKEAIKD